MKTKKRLYSIWHNMKTRCSNPKTEKYNCYGGRGIQVCEEWKNDFNAFYSWAIHNGYDEHLTLDRKDNNGNYEPSNCQWSTRQYQNNHKRNQRHVTHNGETKTAAEWAHQYGISRQLFAKRIRTGWPFERAIQPVTKRSCTE